MLKRYPLDLTGQSPSNLVKRELHTLDVDTENRVLYTRMGAYYNHSLVVKQGTKTLVLNKDYLLFLLWQRATEKTGSPVSRGIHIINKNLLGDIELQYQVVGGEFQDQNEGVTELMALLPHNLKKVYWDEVLEKPSAYIPTQHLHHIHDVFGLSGLIAVVEELRRTVERLSVNRLKVVYDRFLKLKQYVEANLGTLDEQRNKLTAALRTLDEKLSDYATINDVRDLVQGAVADAQANNDARYQALNQRDEELAQALENAKTAITTQLNTLKAKDTELEQTINTVNTTLSGNLTALSNTLNQTKTSLTNSINTAKQEASTALNTLNTTLREYIDQQDSDSITEAVRQAREERDASVTTLNQSIGRVQDALNTAKQDLTNKIAVAEGNVTRSVNTLGNRVTTNEQEIAKLKQKDIELTESITNVADDLNAYKTTNGQNITTMKNDINTLNERLTQIGNVSDGTIAALQQSITQKNTEQDTLIGNLQTELANAKRELTAIDNDLVVRVNALDIRATNLEGNYTTAELRIDDLAANKADKSTVDTLTSKINTLESSIPNSATTVEQSIIDNQITPLRNELTTTQARQDERLTNLEQRATTLESNVSILSSVKADKTAVDSSIDSLQDSIDEINANIVAIPNTIETTLIEPLRTKDTQQDTNIDDLTQRVTALENAPPPESPDLFSEDELTRLVKAAMDRNIAQHAEYANQDVALNLVHPDTEGSVTFTDGATQRIYPISVMDGSVSEMQRNVFAPGTVYEFETDTTWTIPDIYNGLVAQVYVTTGVRGKELPSGSVLFYPPSTKVGYVLLKGGVNVPITVGQISSFGPYITNDGVDKKGVLTPTYPVIVQQGSITNVDEDIRNHFGKHGKVIIVV